MLTVVIIAFKMKLDLHEIVSVKDSDIRKILAPALSAGADIYSMLTIAYNF